MKNTIATIRELATQVFGESNFNINQKSVLVINKAGTSARMVNTYSLTKEAHKSSKELCDILRTVIQNRNI